MGVHGGADVDQPCNSGTSPLLVSSQNGYLAVVEYLVQNGANINQVENKGWTPLLLSVMNNENKVAKFLLRKHANIETTKLFLEKNQLLKLMDIFDKLCKEIEE